MGVSALHHRVVTGSFSSNSYNKVQYVRYKVGGGNINSSSISSIAFVLFVLLYSYLLIIMLGLVIDVTNMTSSCHFHSLNNN